MDSSITLSELLAYSNEERAKWRQWFLQHPEAMKAPLQLKGEISTVGMMLSHIFVAESWHAHRLSGTTWPPEEWTTERPTPEAAFDFGDQVRAKLTGFLNHSTEEMSQPRDFGFPGGAVHQMSHRKTIAFLVFHETRHLAQVATAVRNAGLEPPGKHDLFFSTALA
jgi:uncharacterized damage-inducible protein DinB